MGLEFGMTNGNANKAEVTKEATKEATEEIKEVKQKFSNSEEREAFLSKEYTNKRNVTIALTNNYSFYRKANDKVLDERNEYIGSCVRTSRALASNKEEMNAYFPNLIGVSPSNENYITKVKEYLNNIQVKVDKLGVKLNTSFVYYQYRYYLKYKEAEDKINAEYDAIDKTNTKALKEGLEKKIIALNVLESEQYKYGYPENIADYLLYRHCLLYKDIAKEPALINNDKSIRFWIKDEAKEAKLQEGLRIELNKAKRNYVGICDDDDYFKDVYVQYCVIKGLPITASLAESKIVQQNNLDKFSQEEPVKFNKICSDKQLVVKSLIERLIENGVLNRHPYSQNIVAVDSGDYIGANMKEAVIWFTNPDNANAVEAYKNKLNYM